MIIKINNDKPTITIGNVINHGHNNIEIIFYSGIKWKLGSANYAENIKGSFPNEYYNSKTAVPRYRIFKNNKKIGIALPRFTQNNFPFLYLLKVIKHKPSKNPYYIFEGLGKGHSIIKNTTIQKPNPSYRAEERIYR